MTKQFNADEPNWGLFYREHTKNMDARKSIKVKLPIRQHIKLHSLKLFTDSNISETVEKALDQYFAQMKDDAPTLEPPTGPETAVAGVGIPGPHAAEEDDE